jgi:hypothetical protein
MKLELRRRKETRKQQEGQVADSVQAQKMEAEISSTSEREASDYEMGGECHEIASRKSCLNRVKLRPSL